MIKEFWNLDESLIRWAKARIMALDYIDQSNGYGLHLFEWQGKVFRFYGF